MRELSDFMKALSCGFVIRTPKGILACHPTGHKFSNGHWDLPKGHQERGETNLETAKRELLEETGISIDTYGCDIIDCGEHKYNLEKNLHLFYVELPTIDTTSMSCKSFFNGHMPEIDRWAYTFDTDLFYPRLKPLIDKILEENN